MEYTLLEKIKINRPILFLCGPYYIKSNKGDRRLILQNYIYDKYNNKFLPLVIDDFLTEKNLNDSNIDLQLMEEICAAVSAQTYIFLDTISSAAELGIFANSAYFNKIKVFIPKQADILNKGNVGYFVRDVVLKEDKEKIELIEYRPRIKRVAVATDYVVEHYEFVKNVLPQNIRKNIDEDEIFHENEVNELKLCESSDMPRDPYEVCYEKKGNTLNIHVSIKLLFYVTVSIISLIYKNVLNDKDKDFELFDLKLIEAKVKGAFVNFISGKKKMDFSKCERINLNTVLKKDITILIRHITKFVHVYYLYSQFHNCFLMDKALGSVVQEIVTGKHPYVLFETSEKDIELIKKIKSNTNDFFESYKITRQKKVRKIVKYRCNESGFEAQELHKRMLESVQKQYIFDTHSFAYQHGKSIKQCVEYHMNGMGFVKMDISKFFNSIQFDALLLQVMEELGIDKRYDSVFQEILETCFFEGELPLGLVLSPILSDIFLKQFDEEVSEIFENKGLVYSRYADDILVSSKEKIEHKDCQLIQQIISEKLYRLGLKLNRKKCMFINFDDNHTFIKYLGINIVHINGNNVLSLGKSYINSIAKSYLNFLKRRKILESNKKTYNEDQINAEEVFLYYEKQRIIGQVAFVKQIEGKNGIERINRRLKKYGVNIDFI